MSGTGDCQPRTCAELVSGDGERDDRDRPDPDPDRRDKQARAVGNEPVDQDAVERVGADHAEAEHRADDERARDARATPKASGVRGIWLDVSKPKPKSRPTGSASHGLVALAQRAWQQRESSRPRSRFAAFRSWRTFKQRDRTSTTMLIHGADRFDRIAVRGDVRPEHSRRVRRSRAP